MNTGQWRNALASAGTILDHAPDLANAVVAGDLALDAAYRRPEARHPGTSRRAGRALGGD